MQTRFGYSNATQLNVAASMTTFKARRQSLSQELSQAVALEVARGLKIPH